MSRTWVIVKLESLSGIVSCRKAFCPVSYSATIAATIWVYTRMSITVLHQSKVQSWHHAASLASLMEDQSKAYTESRSIKVPLYMSRVAKG